MTVDWLFRIGDGNNFINSTKYSIWGIKSDPPSGKYFLNNVKPGDRLWFVTSKSNGKIIAVSTYRSHNKREFGPLIDLSFTNEELGWENDTTNWVSDTEIHYTDLYNLSNCELLTHIKCPSTIRKYDDEKCRVNLPVEYSNIVRYSKISFSF